MFEPLTEEEEWKGPCVGPQHFPPTHFFITEPVKWTCPSCGQETRMYPTTVR